MLEVDSLISSSHKADVIKESATHGHVFTRLDWLESDERDLHGQDGSQTIHLKHRKRYLLV